mmetsp:Transcript_11045/g.13361  ORF Transcript_11045/g.13361 Transcript_11045/m.13361 type:complete len:243 (+) Transcript_11045:3-731(+)
MKVAVCSGFCLNLKTSEIDILKLRELHDPLCPLRILPLAELADRSDPNLGQLGIGPSCQALQRRGWQVHHLGQRFAFMLFVHGLVDVQGGSFLPLSALLQLGQSHDGFGDAIELPLAQVADGVNFKFLEDLASLLGHTLQRRGWSSSDVGETATFILLIHRVVDVQLIAAHLLGLLLGRLFRLFSSSFCLLDHPSHSLVLGHFRGHLTRAALRMRIGTFLQEEGCNVAVAFEGRLVERCPSH